MRVHLVALLLFILAAGGSAQALPGRSGQPGLLPPPQPGGPTLSPGAAVASITVSPDSATVDAGACQQFTAEARGPGGDVENVGPFTFTLSNPTAFQGDGSGSICAAAGLPESARTTITVGVAGSQVTAIRSRTSPVCRSALSRHD